MKEVKKERLTAYALGELSPTERAEIEEIIKGNPELQQEVEDIQSFSQMLSQELKSESLPKMTAEARGQVMDEATDTTVGENSAPWWKDLLQGRMWSAGVVMAAFLGLVVFFALQQEMLRQSTESIEGGEQGLETSLAVGKDRSNKPQLIPADGEQVAPNGAPLKEDASEEAFATNQPTSKAEPKNSVALGSRVSDKTELKEFNVKSSPDMLALSDAAHSPSESGSKGVAYGSGRGRLAKRKVRPRSIHVHDDSIGRPYYQPHPGGSYEDVGENIFQSVSQAPLSTFSIDVDTASYTNLRRYITQSNQLPPPANVRIEEMINYFDYQDPAPKGKDPFSVKMEVADSPWTEGHKLVRIGIKGKVFPKKDNKTNLVFLVDVSGSMDNQDKIGLLKEGLHKLVEELNEEDHVSLVTYAGHSAVVLDATSADRKKSIHQAIDNLTAAGSTHGSEGIKTAYELAQKNFRKEGVNRVILATDGDFNVGTTSDQALVELVQDKAKKGVFLTVLGFGSGNLNDSMMEKISNKGNGNYFYIDSEKEARKVLVDKLQGTLVTIAKDVKIQVEFNPNNVAEYRLIGYENRKLAAKDFNDDKKDAGEIGAGHSVVALYEIKPKGFEAEGVDPLKYQANEPKTKVDSKGKFSDELLTVKLRYKKPNGQTSQLLKFPVAKASRSFASASADLRWTASVAGFGMLLKNSSFKGTITYDKLIQWAEKARWGGKGYDSERGEFLEILKKAKRLSGK